MQDMKRIAALLLVVALIMSFIPVTFASATSLEVLVTTEPTSPTQGSDLPASVTEDSEPPQSNATDPTAPTEPTNPPAVTDETVPLEIGSLMDADTLALPASDDGAMPAEGGSSGSNTNLPGTNAPGGKGTLYFSSFGVTMQVVYHPYDSLLENTEGLTTDAAIVQKIRENSYDNIIDLVTDRYQDDSYSNSWTKNVDGGTTTVYNGRGINPNFTFVIDPFDGIIYRVGQSGNGTLDMSTGRWYMEVSYGHNMYKPSTEYTSVSTEADAGIENYIRQICDGLGAWDKEDVAKTASGGEATSVSDDASLYARVLRYLGCESQYIDNYVKAFTGQLAADSKELVPSIVWSFVVFEMQGQFEYATILPMANIGDAHALNTDLYTSDAVTNGNGGFAKSWWTKAFPYGESYLTLHNYHNDNQRDWDISTFKTCYNKPENGNSSWACLTAFGHNQEYYGGHGFGPSLGPNCPIHAEGAGFVNHINADGVDEDSGDQYYFRGYWTAYGSPRIKPPSYKGQIGVKKAVEGAAADASSLTNWLFYVYRDKACTDYVTSIYTTGDGTGITEKLDLGQYYVVEAPYSEQAGRGDIGSWFQVDAPVIPVTVEANTVSWAVTANDYTAKNAYGKQIQIYKEPDCSADVLTQISGNPMYSLSGAVYDVFSADGTYMESLTTGSDGKTTVSQTRFPVGFSGYLLESAAPKGFLLNKEKVSFTVTASSPSVIAITVKDRPIFDPAFAITKVDAATTTPQGNSSFSGAVFRWDYYSNTGWSGSPMNTWYFKTDANGYAYYSASYLASGYTSDPLYADEGGVYQLPLGSVKITEVKNSLGYTVLPEPLYFTITENSGESDGATVTWTEASLKYLTDIRAGVYSVEEPIDRKLFGAVTIQKADSALGATPQGSATLAGAVFEVINNSTGSVQVGDNPIAAPGEVCCTLTADSNGMVATDYIFPVGKYAVREKTAPTGYVLNKDWSKTFTVTAGKRDFAFTVDNQEGCYNEVLRGGLEIIKQDSVLLNQTDSSAKLEGITFTVYSDNPNPVVVHGQTYNKGDAVLVLEIAWDGNRWCAASAPDALPYGSYIIKENPWVPDASFANEFYFLNEGSETITIDGQNTVKSVTFTNTLRPAKIVLEKVNHEGSFLVGTKFLLEWSSDGSNWQPVFSSDVITPGGCNSPGLENGCLIIPDTGILEFTGLDPRIQYRLTELEAPDGYSLLRQAVFEGTLPTEDLQIQLRVVNVPVFEMPKTGGRGFLTIPLSILAATCFLLACFGMLRKKREV